MEENKHLDPFDSSMEHQVLRSPIINTNTMQFLYASRGSGNKAMTLAKACIATKEKQKRKIGK